MPDPVERRSLVGCAVVASLILVPPLDLAAAGLNAALALGLWLFHRRASAREARAVPRSPA